MIPMRNLFILSFIAVVALFSSCERNKDKIVLPGSNGKFNEVLVILDYKDWEGKIGTELKKILQANIPGLPQPEPLFSVMQIDPDNFSGSLRKNRNIIKLLYGDENKIEIKNDVNARPQAYIFITAKSPDDFVALIRENADKIVKSIRESDLGDIQRRAFENRHKENFRFFTANKLKMNIPGDFELIDDREDFIWFRKRFQAGHSINGSMNIFGYVVPRVYPYEVLRDSIISLRNEIGKRYVPGPFDDSYLTTEAAYTPHIYPIEFKGRKAYKTLGKWEIYNDFQAGPFVNITIPDTLHHRTLIVDGLVFAPAIDKRDMMFEVESIIKTLEIQ
jgi:hypothetical protein